MWLINLISALYILSKAQDNLVRLVLLLAFAPIFIVPVIFLFKAFYAF